MKFSYNDQALMKNYLRGLIVDKRDDQWFDSWLAAHFGQRLVKVTPMERIYANVENKTILRVSMCLNRDMGHLFNVRLLEDQRRDARRIVKDEGMVAMPKVYFVNQFKQYNVGYSFTELVQTKFDADKWHPEYNIALHAEPMLNDWLEAGVLLTRGECITEIAAQLERVGNNYGLFDYFDMFDNTMEFVDGIFTAYIMAYQSCQLLDLSEDNLRVDVGGQVKIVGAFKQVEYA